MSFKKEKQLKLPFYPKKKRASYKRPIFIITIILAIFFSGSAYATLENHLYLPPKARTLLLLEKNPEWIGHLSGNQDRLAKIMGVTQTELLNFTFMLDIEKNTLYVLSKNNLLLYAHAEKNKKFIYFNIAYLSEINPNFKKYLTKNSSLLNNNIFYNMLASGNQLELDGTDDSSSNLSSYYSSKTGVTILSNWATVAKFTQISIFLDFLKDFSESTLPIDLQANIPIYLDEFDKNTPVVNIDLKELGLGNISINFSPMQFLHPTIPTTIQTLNDNSSQITVGRDIFINYVNNILANAAYISKLNNTTPSINDLSQSINEVGRNPYFIVGNLPNPQEGFNFTYLNNCFQVYIKDNIYQKMVC